MHERSLLLSPPTPREALDALAREQGWVVAEAWPRTQHEHSRKAWWVEPNVALLYMEIASIYARVVLIPPSHLGTIKPLLQGALEVETLEQVIARVERARAPHERFEAFLQTAAFELQSSGDPEYVDFVLEHLHPRDPLMMRGALLIIETLGWPAFAQALKLQIQATPTWASELAQVLARIEVPEDRA